MDLQVSDDLEFIFDLTQLSTSSYEGINSSQYGQDIVDSDSEGEISLESEEQSSECRWDKQACVVWERGD